MLYLDSCDKEAWVHHLPPPPHTHTSSQTPRRNVIVAGQCEGGECWYLGCCVLCVMAVTIVCYTQSVSQSGQIYTGNLAKHYYSTQSLKPSLSPFVLPKPYLLQSLIFPLTPKCSLTVYKSPSLSLHWTHTPTDRHTHPPTLHPYLSQSCWLLRSSAGGMTVTSLLCVNLINAPPSPLPCCRCRHMQ